MSNETKNTAYSLGFTPPVNVTERKPNFKVQATFDAIYLIKFGTFIRKTNCI